ncbi:hypothetical protein DCE93_02805 [Agromyces badenianii]|uniref:Uncharacterized protein n=1 Tax=Agromyces badenianii TaxID=2080742 RepID=A0A2S0WTQ5_9MICO|nr:hypothetical protein [Agromyces badenianii]AWB94719.1 hypothetical protein DCE93_02805 [Agromyces badenianii]
MNTVARRFSIIASVAAALALSGCTFGPPVATPSPEAVATPTPTPTAEPAPVDPLTRVAEIVVRPEHLEFRDAADTVVSTLSYDADTATFVGTLSTVFAAEPGQTESPGGMEGPPATAYWWGDGVRVWDDHDESNGWGPIDMNVSILFTAPVVGDGITVRTSTGFAPGSDVQALAAELGEPWYGSGYDQVRVETGEPIGEQNFDEYENAYSVAVNAWEAYGSSGAVLAPWNFGIGHV